MLNNGIKRNKWLLILIPTFLFFIFILQLEPLEPLTKFHCRLASFKNRTHIQPDTSLASDIFFIESTCSEELSGRQACSIESACVHNPDSVIALKHLAPYLNELNPFLWALRQYPNFRTISINPAARVRGTVLEDWLLSGKWEPEEGVDGEYPATDISNAFRLLELVLDGGLYLDLDCVVLKPLNGLANIAGLEDSQYINTAVMQFNQTHHPIPTAALEKLVINWKGNTEEWGTSGPKLLTHILKEKFKCDMKPNFCASANFEMLPPNAFYPISYEDYMWLLQPNNASEVFKSINDSFIVHMSNKLTRNSVIRVGDGSFYDLVAAQNCPTIYKLSNYTNGIL